MESTIKSVFKNGPLTIAIIVLAIVAIAYTSILGMNPDEQEELLYLLQDFLPIIMFASLAMLLFSGFPVAFILGGLALLFGLFGYFLDVFSLIEFFCKLSFRNKSTSLESIQFLYIFFLYCYITILRTNH